MPSNFYKQVYSQCEQYFGKNTKSFLDRQIGIHLFKSPETLESVDQSELARWIWLSAAFILGKHKAKDLADSIISL